MGGWREVNRFTLGVLVDVGKPRSWPAGCACPIRPVATRATGGSATRATARSAISTRLSGKCEAVCSLPGFTRGLCFAGNHALVGLSKIRDKHVLDAPPIPGATCKSRAGVALVDLASGQQTGMLEFVRGGREVYEVVFLPSIKRPEVIDFEKQRRFITVTRQAARRRRSAPAP